jgi:hypothetical protein
VSSYKSSLSDELARAGIDGGLRRRILAEIGDHLECDPAATLGAPRDLARDFADQLGTARALRAALVGFAALAVAGAVSVAALLTIGPLSAEYPHVYVALSGLGTVAGLIAVLSGQVALIAGSLAAVRAFRRRREAVLPRAEAVVIVRRIAVGIAAGLASMLGLAIVVVELGDAVAGSWRTFVLIGCAVSWIALLAAAPAVRAAARLRPVAAGGRGDLFDDLGPLVPTRVRGHDWALALGVAGAVAIVITLAGVAQSDGFDGAARGIADALACLAGFALLGCYLGIRSTNGSTNAHGQLDE